MNSTSMRIPPPINEGRGFNSRISYIECNYREYLKNKDGGEKGIGMSATRHACGFPIPEFQRESAWTTLQKIKFIESAWLELPLGSFTHQAFSCDDNCEGVNYSGILIDGQQRLSAIQDYLEDKFKVFNLFYSELNRFERRRFSSISFPHFETSIDNLDEIKELYNRLSLGGTSHTEAQRAI